MNDSLGSVPNEKIKAVLNELSDDTEITFEFLVASFFKDAYVNMQNLLKDAYTNGYMQAKLEQTNEN